MIVIVQKFRSKMIRSIVCFGLILVFLSSSLLTTWAMTGVYSNVVAASNMGLSVELVKDSTANASIILLNAATEDEKQAAQTIQEYIEKISGAKLPIVTDESQAAGIKIYIGKASPDYNAGVDRIRAKAKDKEAGSFRLLVTQDAIHLAGLDDIANDIAGVRYAAYELLEQLGMRWIMPGELGTVIPEATTVALAIQDTMQVPGYKLRFLQALTYYASYRTFPMTYDPTEAVDWAKFNRLGGQILGQHGFPGPETPATKPEWCYIVDGKPSTQFDVTKPEVLEYTVNECVKLLEKNPDLEYISISPEDGGGFGDYIEGWDAGDFDMLNGRMSFTDRYVKFYNLVLDELTKKGYDKVRIAFYAYYTYTNPPIREIPNERLLAMIAPYSVDRIHTAGNPLAPERTYIEDIIKIWKELGDEVMYRGYLYNLFDPGLPFSMVPQVASEFKRFYDLGVDRARLEAAPSWGYHGPALYLSAKMMWNPNIDVEATMNDYYEKFYGPACSAMQAHFKVLEDAFENTDYNAGGIYDFHEILTAEVMAQMEAYLELAEQLAKSDSNAVYAKRVDMIRTSFDFGDNFLKMLDDNYKYDFESAKAKLDKVNELSLKAIAHAPVILYPYTLLNVRRHAGEKIMDAYQRVINGNKILAVMPDGWRMILDPKGGGEELGLWEPGLGVNSWRPIEIAPKTWSAQGLRYYNGDAWYRNSVTIPESARGKEVRLFMGSVDEVSYAWVNGVKLPIVKGGVALEKSREFDATNSIKFGEENIVVIKVENRRRGELGMGGITGPVMFWEVNAMPDTTPPTIIKNFKAEAIDGRRIKMTWDAATDESGIGGYYVYSNDGILEAIVGPDVREYITKRMPGKSYNCSIKPIDIYGNIYSPVKGEDKTNPIITVVPSEKGGESIPPTKPEVIGFEAVSDSEVKVTFKASTDNVGVVRYEITDNKTPTNIYGNFVLTQEDLEKSELEYTITGLKPDTNYKFFVTAYDAVGNSNKSADKGTIRTLPDMTPQSPTELMKGSVSDTEITISWTASASDGVTGYEVYQDGIKITESIVNDTIYTVTGLEPETEYTFTVRAVVTEEKKSVESSALKVKTIAAPVTLADPKNVRGGALDNVSVKLIWDISDGIEVVGYNVYQGDEKIVKVDKMVTEYIVTDLGDNRVPETTDMKEYSFIVKSVDSKGTEFDGVEVKVQVGVRAEVVDSTSIKVIWAHRIDAEKYRIKQKIDNGVWTIITGEFTDTEYVVSGLESGKKYQFMIFPFVNNKWVVDNPYRLGMSMAETFSQ